MLSPIRMFILGIIEYEPVNPYVIIYRFNFNKMFSTMKVAESTIYANIRALHRQKYITFELHQNSKMPPKKVYTITDKGKEQLDLSIRSYLSDYYSEWSGFTVAILLSFRYEKKVIIELLESRVEVLKQLSHIKEEEYNLMSKLHELKPCITALSGAIYLDMIIKNELTATINILEAITETNGWSNNMFSVSTEDFDEFKSKNNIGQGVNCKGVV